MTFLLDTNTCIDYLTGRHPSLRSRLLAHRPAEIAIPADVALDNRVDYLVTRTTDDYPREPSFVMTPTVFLDTLPS